MEEKNKTTLEEEKVEKQECQCEEDCHCDDSCQCEEECQHDDNCQCHDDDCHCGETHDTDDTKKKKNKIFSTNRKEDKLKKEIEELKNKVKELENKNLMASAELINYRKRKDEEVSRMLKYANEDLILEILPILDNFERAIKLDDENLNDELSRFLEGFKMIYCHLKKSLEDFDVKAIDGNNKPFDPTYHQAVLTEHIDGMEPGMVIEVLQKGYLLKDKVIRTAMVRVSE